MCLVQIGCFGITSSYYQMITIKDDMRMHSEFDETRMNDMNEVDEGVDDMDKEAASESESAEDEITDDEEDEDDEEGFEDDDTR